MSRQIARSQLEDIGRIVPPERLAARPATRPFDLPPILHGLTVGAYVLALVVMGIAFGNPELAIPFAIFFFYIAMFFGVPALWARVAPRSSRRYQSWGEFLDQGIEIQTGHIGSGGAITQVLLLPALILVWAIVVSIIAVTI